jgi:hypothetical protein
MSPRGPARHRLRLLQLLLQAVRRRSARLPCCDWPRAASATATAHAARGEQVGLMGARPVLGVHLPSTHRRQRVCVSVVLPACVRARALVLTMCTVQSDAPSSCEGRRGPCHATPCKHRMQKQPTSEYEGMANCGHPPVPAGRVSGPPGGALPLGHCRRCTAGAVVLPGSEPAVRGRGGGQPPGTPPRRWPPLPPAPEAEAEAGAEIGVLDCIVEDEWRVSE